ncbi:helix-turn-helix domain-containing protein, partial [Hydrococcus rivularis]|uniref:transposase family protein n=1 Tax=Hydrococcus rivularis TaxID=1616834 RepID=UPI001C31C175
MVKVLEAEKVLQKKTGRPSKLSAEDQILMTLEYWREYRTYFHIGTGASHFLIKQKYLNSYLHL